MVVTRCSSAPIAEDGPAATLFLTRRLEVLAEIQVADGVVNLLSVRW